MTPEEAIHELKIIKKEIATYEVNTPRCKVMRWSTVTCDTFKTATEALAKQIPKKPDDIGVESYALGEITMGYCPSCGLWVKILDHYCSRCGQALDWSEVES